MNTDAIILNSQVGSAKPHSKWLGADATSEFVSDGGGVDGGVRVQGRGLGGVVVVKVIVG